MCLSLTPVPPPPSPLCTTCGSSHPQPRRSPSIGARIPRRSLGHVPVGSLETKIGAFLRRGLPSEQNPGRRRHVGATLCHGIDDGTSPCYLACKLPVHEPHCPNISGPPFVMGVLTLALLPPMLYTPPPQTVSSTPRYALDHIPTRSPAPPLLNNRLECLTSYLLPGPYTWRFKTVCVLRVSNNHVGESVAPMQPNTSTRAAIVTPTCPCHLCNSLSLKPLPLICNCTVPAHIWGASCVPRMALNNMRWIDHVSCVRTWPNCVG